MMSYYTWVFRVISIGTKRTKCPRPPGNSPVRRSKDLQVQRAMIDIYFWGIDTQYMEFRFKVF